MITPATVLSHGFVQDLSDRVEYFNNKRTCVVEKSYKKDNLLLRFEMVNGVVEEARGVYLYFTEDGMPVYLDTDFLRKTAKQS